jgi:hypothetical protein
MPYKTRKVANKRCYRVYNAKTRRVFAKCATAENAQKQLRLLRAIENNKNFVPNGRVRRGLRRSSRLRKK